MPSTAFVARSGRLALVAVTLLGAAAGGAQEGRFSGSVEVHTVTVEVEVTRRGRPVTGLTREDFRILEDGEEREITHFAWVGGGTTLQGPGGEESVTAPPGAQAPHVLLLFDLNGLRGPRLARAVEAAREWLDAGRDREVLWSVAAVGTRPRILLPFTRDPAAARSALESVTSLPRPAPASSAGADLALDPASYQPTLSRGAGPGEAAGTPRSTLERFTDLLAWQEARDRVERFALLARGLATAPLRRGTPPPPGLVGELPVGRVIPAGLSPSESPPEPAPEEAPAGSPAPPVPDDARSRELQRALSWIEGPARWLLTPAERAGILASRTPEEVQEQIRLFWARRDPDPRAPGNPARDAFLERVAAADALLGEPGLAGSLTERGRVLILLGKPRNRRRSADLQVDTWFYDRTAVAAVAHRVHVPPVLQFQFRRDPEGHFHLADVNPAKQEAALRILETLPGASIRNPHMVSAPIPPLFDGFPAATGEELELLASGLETWPGDAVAVAYPEAFPGRPRRCLAVLRLPSRLPRASGAVGLVLDRNRRIAGSFRIPLEGRVSPWGVTYQLSIPVPDDDAALEILLVDGERPVAGTRVPLALETAPPGTARLLPIITGAGLERREHFPPWSTNLFGGNRLEVRPEGRFLPGEDLYFFFVALNPPQPPGAPPAADVEVAVLRDGEPVARGRWEGVDLSMMAPGTFLFGSSFPVAAIGEVGRYTLRFRVELHGSEVARVMTLPLVISTP